MNDADAKPNARGQGSAGSFGALLRGYRRASGLTQEALARESSYSAVYIGMLERGERRALPATAEALAGALGLSEQERARLVRVVRGENASPRRSDLPRPLTSFVGRRREKAIVCEMLRRPGTRLVTLFGPGGVGKTRLAVEVARELAPELEDGTVFVQLDDASDPDLVLVALTESLGLLPRRNKARLDLLREHLHGKTSLLVLDNFEQVVAAAPLIAALLSSCPGVRALVTSRVVLSVSGEHLFEVKPLALPKPEPGPTGVSGPAGAGGVEGLGVVAESDACRLFIDRAQAAHESFALTAENAVHIAEICRLVDGLPLAVELAAVQVRRHSPGVIAREMRHPLPALVGAFKDRPSRHSSLHQTFEWSFRLLDHSSRDVFARLSVFSGGCSLEQAEQVCRLPRDPSVAAAIDALVDASLVQIREFRGSDHRLTMLQTVREFAAEKLVELGDEEATRRRHLAAVVNLGELYDKGFRGADSESWLRRFDVEYGNLTAALEWSLQHDPVAGLRLAGAMQTYWDMRALIRTGRQWLESLLEAEPRGSDDCDERRAWRARGLMGAGSLAWLAGDEKSAERFGREGYGLFRDLGDSAELARAANQFGIISMFQERFDQARESFEEALALYTTLNDERGVYTVTNNLGVVAISDEDYARAAELLKRSLVLSREYGDIRSKARAMTNLGFALLHLGDSAQAKGLARESLMTRSDIGDPRGVCESLELLAGVAVAEDNWSSAARLLGASSKLRAEHGVGFATQQLEAFVTTTSGEARARLGEEAYAAAVALWLSDSGHPALVPLSGRAASGA